MARKNQSVRIAFDTLKVYTSVPHGELYKFLWTLYWTGFANGKRRKSDPLFRTSEDIELPFSSPQRSIKKMPR